MDQYPVWSPDGRRVIFSSSRSGTFNLYWQAADRNGSELFYLAPDGTVLGVRIEAGASWRTSTPEKIFQGLYYFPPSGTGRSFDITPDGKRFLLIKELGADTLAAAPRLLLVQNWVEELKQLVPTPR